MKKLLSLLAAVIMLWMLCVPVMAESKTITPQQFVDAVIAGNGTYDGHGVTVEWTAVSGCRDNRPSHVCKVENVAATINTPNRIQSNCAQYHLFASLKNDISISNVNFNFTPPTSLVVYCHNGSWDDGTQIVTAVLQYENDGDVTYTNCTFNRVAVRVWRSSVNNDVTTISNCSFKNTYSYALKDIRTPTIIVDHSSFTDCDKALLVNMPENTSVQKIQLTNNTFTNVNTNDASTDHLVQFNRYGDYSNAKILFSNNAIANCGAHFCVLNNTFKGENVSSDLPVTYPAKIPWESEHNYKPSVTPCAHPNGKLSGKKDATTESAGYTGDFTCPDCLHVSKGTVTSKLEPTAAPTAVPTVVPASSSLPQTGDESNVALWMALMAVSVIAFALLNRKSRFN